jgi:hypothetical protein
MMRGWFRLFTHSTYSADAHLHDCLAAGHGIIELRRLSAGMGGFAPPYPSQNNAVFSCESFTCKRLVTMKG